MEFAKEVRISKRKSQNDHHRIDRETSSKYLRAKCIAALVPKSRAIFFPSLPAGKLLVLKKTKTLDVVLFGDAPYSVLNISNWPPYEYYRIWCLSSAMQKALRRTAKLDAQVIRIRFGNQETVEQSFSGVIRFVFAGRIGADKNLILLTKLVYQLQKDGFPIQLRIIGEFDNSRLDKFVYKRTTKFSETFAQLLDRLEWKYPLIIEAPKAPKAWIKTLEQQDIFISLSTHWTEDYGVAVRQALSAGSSAVLSEWGGHKDVTGRAILVPIEFLGSTSAENVKKLSRFIVSALDLRSGVAKIKHRKKTVVDWPDRKYSHKNLLQIETQLANFLEKDAERFWQCWSKAFS